VGPELGSFFQNVVENKGPIGFFGKYWITSLESTQRNRGPLRRRQSPDVG
jgi:hypothetical protein